MRRWWLRSVDILCMAIVQLMIMETSTLKTEDREFFSKVRLAIFLNPFSDERSAVDRELTAAGSSMDKERQIQLLIQVVDNRLRQIGPEKKVISRFRGEDRELVQYGVLFHIFHKYCFSFDQHIQDQILHGEEPDKVRFAEAALAEMALMGVERQESVRYFSLFFQMRRAFYFIERIVGSSPCMKELRRSLWNNIFTHDIWIYDRYLCNRMEDFSTMLLGPTGTGKGLAASAIGRSGYIPYLERKNCFAESFTRAFVSINLSQYPEQLLESELFGHKRGAFTGAVEGHAGVFSLCSPAGAIFLDEIGEVGIPVQVKLLQVLQDRLFSPVGSHRKERFEGRVIAATNRPIDELRAKKLFRDDFYYRLCSDIIHMPPLFQRIRENPDELADLLNHTVARITGTESADLVADILKVIRQQVPKDYSWPGNVRELEQCVRRVLLKRQYEGDTLPAAIGGEESLHRILLNGNFTAQQLLSTYCSLLYKQLGTYESVAKRTGLDRRTVKKYIETCGQGPAPGSRAT